MSDTLLQAKTPLWRAGRNSNIEFLSSFSRLQREDPQVYAIIDQKEGYVCQDRSYEYRVGKNQYGLWVSRRRLGLEGFKQIEDKPPVRPSMANPPPELEELKTRVERLERAIEAMVNGYQSR